MSKEKELAKILKTLGDFVEEREGHALGVIIYPPSDEAAKDEFIAHEWVHWIKKGNTTITLDLIRHKFAKILKRLEERDKTIARDIKKREKAKK